MNNLARIKRSCKYESYTLKCNEHVATICSTYCGSEKKINTYKSPRWVQKSEFAVLNANFKIELQETWEELDEDVNIKNVP